MANELSVIAPRGIARTFDSAELYQEWIADMQDRVKAGELAATTAATYARGMKRFLEWLEGENLASVGVQAIRRWKAALVAAGHKPAGVNVFYAGVKAFFTWAVSERGLAYSPTAGEKGAKRARARRHKREALTDNEVLRVLAQPSQATVSGKRDRAMLYLMAYTGARSVEIQRATVGDLHANGRLKLMVQGKGHDEPDEPVFIVNQGALDALYDWLAVHPGGNSPAAPLFCGLGNRNNGRALSMRTIRELVKGYYKAAGIRDERKTTHSLRHSLVTNLIRHGAAPTEIMTVTRHRSLDTLLSYAHELARDDNPAELLVDYSNGTGK